LASALFLNSSLKEVLHSPLLLTVSHHSLQADPKPFLSQLDHSNFDHNLFSRSRLGHSQFSNSRLGHSQFSNSRLGRSQFSNSKLVSHSSSGVLHPHKLDLSSWVSHHSFNSNLPDSHPLAGHLQLNHPHSLSSTQLL